MKNLIPLLKKCRPVNLLTVSFLQFFLYKFLFYDFLQQGHIALKLSILDIVLLTLDLAVIMAAGYLINDIFDEETDRLHSAKRSLSELGIQHKTAQKAYAFLLLFGFSITIYLAAKYDEWPLSLLYPAANLILYVYARKLKSSVLWGNLLIAVLCCLPTLLIYLAERSQIKQIRAINPEVYQFFWLTIITYLIFAFLSTLIREIIKDMEDSQADSEAGIITFANSKDSRTVKGLLFFLEVIFLLLIGVIAIYFFNKKNIPALVFSLLSLIPLILWNLYHLRGAETSASYKRLSSSFKLIMILGIGLLAFIHH